MANKTIVYIDDEAAVCRALTALLEQEGYDIVSFTSAPDAIAYLATNQPALIICDVHMPEMDGLAVLDALVCSVPFYLITGELVTDDLGVPDARVAGILQKPFHADELLAVVRKHTT
jgi:two-component system C4-dicarboxylate transport response regulator DctD